MTVYARSCDADGPQRCHSGHDVTTHRQALSAGRHHHRELSFLSESTSDGDLDADLPPEGPHRPYGHAAVLIPCNNGQEPSPRLRVPDDALDGGEALTQPTLEIIDPIVDFGDAQRGST